MLAGIKLFALVAVVSQFKDLGTWIGEGIAKLQGYKDKTVELEAAEKSRLDLAKEQRAITEAQELANKAAIESQFGLSKAAQASVATFTALVKEGKSASDAIKEIGKDFDLSTSPGIRNAVTVLDKLVTDGKLSAEQFQKAWADALKGEDLAVFEVRFKTAMMQMQVDADRAAKAVQDAIARGVSGKELEDLQAKAATAFSALQRETERSGQVMDATLREAVRRTGLDMKLISDGMGAAAAKSLNDTDVIIGGLDKLRSQGVDVGTVLEASLTKALNTADGQKAIDEVRARVESLRTVLGDKVADGLLDQARVKADALKESLDKTKPGIQGVEEAMRLLGVTSDASLNKTAATAKTAYDEMVKAGTASARELGEGFKKAADAAIAANNGIAPSWVVAQAAARGYSVEVDAAGKTTVRSMRDASAAVGNLTTAHKLSAEAVKANAEAVDKLMMKYMLSSQFSERQIALLEKENALLERRDALERKRLNIDKEGFSLNTAGKRVEQNVETKRGVFENAKSQGLTEAQALAIADQFIDDAGRQKGFGGANFAAGENFSTVVQKAIDDLVLQNARNGNSTNNSTSPAKAGTPAPAPTSATPTTTATTSDVSNVRPGERVLSTSQSGPVNPTTGRTVTVRLMDPQGNIRNVETTEKGAVELIRALQAASLTARG